MPACARGRVSVRRGDATFHTGGKRPVSCPGVLNGSTFRGIAEQRHRDLKQTLKVRPVFSNDDRIEALIAVIGIALLVFGLIEAELRALLGPGTPPEGRAAVPTTRAALAAFDGLCAARTPAGIRLDRLTPAQRMILASLDIPLPWATAYEDRRC